MSNTTSGDSSSAFHFHGGPLIERRRLHCQTALWLIGLIRLETHFAFSSPAAAVRGTSCTLRRSSLSGTLSCFEQTLCIKH